ncbi:hypothetical protein HO173_004723 [Letharia columbiana]|uniref:Uncharacterized protein n=1 Tax=Letharia columbiana TaxID=112416 RepID=A0A8H6L6G5_9LECA|nr:uncharacterized protein HO173_004723 [Letharia columbiana]KAF6237254.1 hypothetical protein HO173_004723 [Letharia columbiana]
MDVFLVVVLAAITLVAGEVPGYSIGVANRNATFDYIVIGGGTVGPRSLRVSLRAHRIRLRSLKQAASTRLIVVKQV